MLKTKTHPATTPRIVLSLALHFPSITVDSRDSRTEDVRVGAVPTNSWAESSTRHTLVGNRCVAAVTSHAWLNRHAANTSDKA